MREFFASAHATWVALELAAARARLELLCLSTRCVGCIVSMTPSGAYSGSLPQHTLRGLHYRWNVTTKKEETFASAHAAWVALANNPLCVPFTSLCLSTRCVGCIIAVMATPLPEDSFASAHAAWVAFSTFFCCCSASLLCLSTRCVGCIAQRRETVLSGETLPQHTLRGLHWQKHIKYFALFCRMCCKLVDSFSVEQRMLTALTIFPDFSAAKATYVAIIDSLGRTIDRFLWCEHPVFFLLTSTSPDAHTGRCLWHLA